MDITITWWGLAWCALPVVIVAGIFYLWQEPLKDLWIATARMTVQLLAIGYVLIAIFENPSPWISLVILIVMLTAAGWIAIRPVRHHRGFFAPAALALGSAVILHLAISLFAVIDVASWYEPRVLIPLAGMYFANGMNAVSLAAERYHAELHDGIDAAQARNVAFNAAMIPQINSLLAVGLVALPGMMTGQILSGVSPLIAVRFQILIMTMTLGTSGLAAALMLWQLRNRPLTRET